MPVLIAVQSEMTARAYRSEAAFRAWLRESVAPARGALATDEPALVAFPEAIGMALLLTGAPAAFWRCRTWLQAGILLAARNWRELRANQRRYAIGWRRGLLLALSRRYVRRLYLDSFTDLARELGATVVAGSVPMEGPEGQVRNIACVFGPDGRLLGEQHKVNLTRDEGPLGLAFFPGSLEETHPIETPVGRVGVAICLDGFDVDTSRGAPRPQPSVVTRLATEGAEILVQPSCNPKPWTPEEAAGWSEGMERGLAEHPGFACGLNPMMVGRVLNLKAEGMSAILGPGARKTLARATTHREGECLVVRV